MEENNIMLQPNEEAVMLNERIKSNGQIAVNAVCNIGRDLRRMKIEELYTYLGYGSFEEYAEQEKGEKTRRSLCAVECTTWDNQTCFAYSG